MLELIYDGPGFTDSTNFYSYKGNLIAIETAAGVVVRFRKQNLQQSLQDLEKYINEEAWSEDDGYHVYWQGDIDSIEEIKVDEWDNIDLENDVDNYETVSEYLELLNWGLFDDELGFVADDNFETYED